MLTPDDIVSALPAPRDDEPAELRAQIAKELRDHLQCAVQREMVLSADEAEATRRALVRFGNPARIARQLWFDALWEKIMSQRILVDLCAVMTAACIGMGLFNWRTAADSAEAVRKLIEHSDAANRSLVEQSRDMHRLMLEQSRESNQALLERMGSFVATSGVPQSSEWVPVKIRLVLDTPEGAPAVGYKVHVYSFQRSSSEGRIDILETTSTNGLIDCGRLRSGNYWASVTTAWQEEHGDSFYVRAGVSEQVETIVCPSAELPTADVTFELDLPEDLRGRPLGILCDFSHSSRILDDKEWKQLSPGNWGTRIVTETGGVWTMSRIDSMPKWEPPRARLFDMERVDRFRWASGKHGLRVKGVVVLAEGRSPGHEELVPWIPAGENEHGIYSELTTDAGAASRLKIPVPEQLFDQVRATLGQKADTRKNAKGKSGD